jgi:hypothetical protein
MMEHNSSEFPFTADAALNLYNALVLNLQEKIDTKSYRAIPSDIKVALDQISEC